MNDGPSWHARRVTPCLHDAVRRGSGMSWDERVGSLATELVLGKRDDLSPAGTLSARKETQIR